MGGCVCLSVCFVHHMSAAARRGQSLCLISWNCSHNPCTASFKYKMLAYGKRNFKEKATGD